jgi:uncharacterized protein (TIGR02391 family)
MGLPVTAISKLVPDVEDLLALEVEDLAGVLLAHLNHHPGHLWSERYSYTKFFEDLLVEPPLGTREYGARNEDANLALMEAWAWLEREGLLVKDAHTAADDAYFISRRGRRMKSRDDLKAYRMANTLPKAQLHPLISSRVYPAFLRGDYDTAVFQAFKEVEVAVRAAGDLPNNIYGEQLMRTAFAHGEGRRPGPLADETLPLGEQAAMAHLFAGAFGTYRNSTGHRHVGTEPVDAADAIVLASQLLRIVDRAKQSSTARAA